MNELYPLARLGQQALLIHSSDLPHVGNERSLEVKTVKVDLVHHSIEPIWDLEKHLKFNPWEETTAVERLLILQSLAKEFSEREILEQIVVPLVLHAIKEE